MSEERNTAVQTATAEPSAPQKKAKGPATHEQKQKRRKLIRRIIALVVALAIIITSVVLLRKFVFKGEDTEKGAPMTAIVELGTIQSKVSGSGTARAKKAATVTPESGYMVLELLVQEGDQVEEGQLLYNLDDTAAQDEVRNKQANVIAAQDTVIKRREELQSKRDELSDLYKQLDDLVVKAPHAGKLTEVNQDIKTGDELSSGTSVATLVNDTKLRLRLYYSWAYEGKIQPGQSARVSLPGMMADYPATVEAVNYVKRVVPEGSVTFEVVFVMDNPGTLTAGMAASATLSGADGTAIYPYENGSLEFFETTKLSLKADGPVEYVHLMNYAEVTAGQVLARLGDEKVRSNITSAENTLRETYEKSVEDAVKTVEEAQKAVEEAQEKLDNYHAVSPIAGTVLSLGGLTIGSEVPSGGAIQIADTSTMIVDISIDERNIGYVNPGMYVDLQDEMDNYYMGVIETVALSAKAENGVATFPATVVVDNTGGTLRTNSYIRYSMVASQSSDCMVVPLQAVMNVSLPGANGNTTGVEFDPNNYSVPGIDPDAAIDDGGLPDDGGDMPVDDTFPEPPEGEAIPEGGDGTDGADGTDSVDDTAGDDANAGIDTGEIVIDDQPAARARVSFAGGGVMIMDDGFGSVMGPGAFETSDTATICFVKGTPDDRAIEADEAWEVPEGFFPVIVTTGLSDEANVEIKTGLQVGDEVFIGYETDSAYAGW